MRTLLLLMVVAIGGIALVKGTVNFSTDDHVRPVGGGLAIPGLTNMPNIAAIAGQATAQLSQVAAALNGQTTGPATPGAGRTLPVSAPGGTTQTVATPTGTAPTATVPAAPKAPPLPRVTSANDTYIPPGIPPAAARPREQVAAPRTGEPTNSQSPFNPAAYRDRFETVVKALRGSP